MYPVYVTALGTGLRRGELLGLKWEALDLEAGMALIKRNWYRSKVRLSSRSTQRQRAVIELLHYRIW